MNVLKFQDVSQLKNDEIDSIVQLHRFPKFEGKLYRRIAIVYDTQYAIAVGERNTDYGGILDSSVQVCSTIKIKE